MVHWFSESDCLHKREKRLMESITVSGRYPSSLARWVYTANSLHMVFDFGYNHDGRFWKTLSTIPNFCRKETFPWIHPNSMGITFLAPEKCLFTFSRSRNRGLLQAMFPIGFCEEDFPSGKFWEKFSCALWEYIIVIVSLAYAAKCQLFCSNSQSFLRNVYLNKKQMYIPPHESHEV